MYRNFFLIIVIITLTGCISPTNKQDSALQVIPDEIRAPLLQNGEEISISTPDGWNSFKVGESIYLLIQNLSDQTITADHDLGVKIYLFQNNAWVEVLNNVVYPDMNRITLEPNVPFDPLKVYTLFLLPELPVSSKSDVVLRIFVFWREQSKDAQFSTYIDLNLHK